VSQLRVVKLGGSLLAAPDLRSQLQAWLGRQRGTTILIAGGGELADVIRRYDPLHQLGEEASHWICIRLLSATIEILSELLPDTPVETDFAKLPTPSNPLGESEVVLFDGGLWLRSLEPQQPPMALPHDWRVTSDSIAARLAQVLNANECVLIKSQDQQFQSVGEAAEAGYVDPWLPRLAYSPIRWTTLSGA